MKPSAASPLSYRPEIDGLRALAVCLVVIVHAFPSKLPGGFIGVDVFFVISGFLIGSIIVKQLQAGAFSFLDFYIHRANRIFPALCLVLASCLAFGWFALFADEYASLGRSSAAGAAFVANLSLYQEIGYWDVASKLKPLLHLWSLGVEEQFYIVFPCLLWLCWQRKFNLFGVLLGLSILSGLYMRHTMMGTDHAAAFYLPLQRAWELLAGAMLAWLSLQPESAALAGWQRLKQLKQLSAALGLGMILFAAFKLNDRILFPSKWTLLPVLGAGLLLAAGPTALLNRWLFSNRLVVYVGLISFPLYLWHWPLLSFAHIIAGGEPSSKMRNLALLLSFLLAAATYHGLEKPLRNSAISGARKAALLSVFLLLLGCLGFGIKHSKGLTQRPIEQLKAPDLFTIRRPPVAQDDSNGCFQALPALFKQNLQQGLLAGTQVHCSAARLEDVSIALIGDSNAGHYAQDLHAHFGSKLLTIHSAGRPYLRDMLDDANSQVILDFLLKQAHIKTIVLSHLGVEISQAYTPSLSQTARLFRPGYLASVEKTVRAFQAAGKRVIFVSAMPVLDFDPKRCQARPFSDSALHTRCSMPRAEIAQTHGPYLQAFQQLRRDLPQLEIVDAMDALCDAHTCYVKRDGKILYADFKHVNFHGSSLITSSLLRMIERPASEK